MNKEITCLSDLFMEIGSLIKNYETNVSVNTFKEEHNQLYGINDIIKMYPSLSKYILTNAINEGLLPVTWVGHERHFYINDIENYLQSKTEKVDSIDSWRTYEQV